MSNVRYPQLAVRPYALRSNMKKVVELCAAEGLRVSGLGKGYSSLPECAPMIIEAGCIEYGTSRVCQLRAIKELYPSISTMLVRIPMLSETEDVVKWADVSLNSELAVLRALNDHALRLGKTHKVIIMKDIGDRREGFEDEAEMVDVCEAVERELSGLRLAGVGANYNCYGSISPTKENIDELVHCAEKIEARIGRGLDTISIGGTNILNLLGTGAIHPRVNNARIGIASIAKAEYAWSPDLPGREDPFILRAEIVELKNKPTLPRGVHAAAALNEARHYEDLGIRKRAIVAVGAQDIGTGGVTIEPLDPSIRIWGSSSDHTMLDLEDCATDYKVGDIVEFRINYVACMFLSMSPHVERVVEYI